MLIEETTVPETAFPLEEFRAHLRMGSGFDDDTLQDRILTSFLRAAMSAIEARTGKALYQRGFLLSLPQWQSETVQTLPVAPVVVINQMRLIDRGGFATEVDLTGLRLDGNTSAPRIIATQRPLPPIPDGGYADIRFVGGWSTDWNELPADLAHAVFLLAAHYYEYRYETSLSEGCMPFGVSSLIERYKPVRIGFGDAQ